MWRLNTYHGSLEGGTMLRIFGQGRGFQYNVFVIYITIIAGFICEVIIAEVFIFFGLIERLLL